jgi:tRNA 2-thiouridine synthesizing protein A
MQFLNLQEVPCPMNFVKAKLFLDKLAPQEEVTLYLPLGEASQTVPSSLKEEGHQLRNIIEHPDYTELIVIVNRA